MRQYPFFLYKKISSAHTNLGKRQNANNKEDETMNEHTKDGCTCTPNHSIRCSVEKCAHHCASEAYCGLDSIQVGTHEANPTVDQCTDCQSFKPMQ